MEQLFLREGTEERTIILLGGGLPTKLIRTLATWADQNGITAKQRGELMGNSAEVNAHVYTQVMDHPLRFAMERVGSELFSDCSVIVQLVPDCKLKVVYKLLLSTDLTKYARPGSNGGPPA